MANVSKIVGPAVYWLVLFMYALSASVLLVGSLVWAAGIERACACVPRGCICIPGEAE